ncbi:hypothetical protein ACIBP6_18380 [Nonomuraea terrae]|uniref:hypothetical protein n=1 Tax=Nonomuraea terrae TaxID=2530383 RepID=UPI0037A2B4AC
MECDRPVAAGQRRGDQVAPAILGDMTGAESPAPPRGGRPAEGRRGGGARQDEESATSVADLDKPVVPGRDRPSTARQVGGGVAVRAAGA